MQDFERKMQIMPDYLRFGLVSNKTLNLDLDRDRIKISKFLIQTSLVARCLQPRLIHLEGFDWSCLTANWIHKLSQI